MVLDQITKDRSNVLTSIMHFVLQEDTIRKKKLVNEIKITFNDSPRRGRGGRRPRGPRGGRTGGRGGDRRSANAAPRFDDENDFPSLIKSAA